MWEWAKTIENLFIEPWQGSKCPGSMGQNLQKEESSLLLKTCLVTGAIPHSLIVVWRTILTILCIARLWRQHIIIWTGKASWCKLAFIVLEAGNAGRFKHVHTYAHIFRIHLKEGLHNGQVGKQAAIWTSSQVAHTRLGGRHAKTCRKPYLCKGRVLLGGFGGWVFAGSLKIFRNTLAVICPLWRFWRARHRSFFAPAMAVFKELNTHKQNGIDNIIKYETHHGVMWDTWSSLIPLVLAEEPSLGALCS